MSTTPPPDPKQELNSALLWAALAAAFAVGMFVYAGQVAPEKRNFYYLAGVAGAVVAAVNGYAAWTVSQKGKK